MKFENKGIFYYMLVHIFRKEETCRKRKYGSLRVYLPLKEVQAKYNHLHGSDRKRAEDRTRAKGPFPL